MGKAKRTMPVKGISFVKADPKEPEDSDDELPKPGQKWIVKEPSEESDEEPDEAPDDEDAQAMEDEEEPEASPKKAERAKKVQKNEIDDTEAEAGAEHMEVATDKKQKKEEADYEGDLEYDAEEEQRRKKAEKKRKKRQQQAQAESGWWQEEEQEEKAKVVPEAKAKVVPEAECDRDDEEDSEEAKRRKKADKKKKKRQEQAQAQYGSKPVAEASTNGKVEEREETEKKMDTLFVSGIPWSCDEAKLRQDFSQCGTIKFMNFVMDQKGRPKGIAFITFKGGRGCDEAIKKFDNLEYGGRTLSVKQADKESKPTKGKGKGKGVKGQGQGDKAFEVYLCGLPFTTDETILRKDFEECGEIASLNMLKKPDGACRGVAFITYKNMEAVEKACEYNGSDYGGRWIQVESTASKGTGKGSEKPGKGDKSGKGERSKGKGKHDQSETAEAPSAKKSKIVFDEDDE